MAKRSVKVTVSVRPELYESIKAAADSVGLSVSSWAAFTLGSAASQMSMSREVLESAAVQALMRSLNEIEAGVEHGESEETAE